MRIKLLLILIVVAGGWYAWRWSHGNLRLFIDRTPPVASLERAAAPAGLVRYKLHAHDDRGEVASVVATVRQGEKSWPVQLQTAASVNGEVVQDIEFRPKALGLAEGEAVLEVGVVDSSIWGNKNALTSKLLIDYVPPTISILSQQFVASQGGAEFILYRVGGGTFVRSGAEVGEYFFRGFPGSAIDPRLANYSDVYGVLMAIPLGFDGVRQPMRLIVEDQGGNRATAELTIPIKSTKQVDVESKLSASFLQRKLPDLSRSYEERVGESLPVLEETPASWIPRFRLINEKYRARLQQEVFQLIDAGTPQRLWSGVFNRPVPAATTSLFGERRQYSLDGQSAGGSLHEGLDLASVSNDVVRAVNAGKILFAGELGIYGQAVVVDHGLGLISLYGHLSSIAVSAGVQVTQGQEVGRTGSTGLAGGDHLHFEFRVGHVSVNPIEWWDAKWITDHIDGKINAFLTSQTVTHQ